MSIVLTFAKATGGKISKGPFSSVRFAGEQVYDAERGGKVIAAHAAYGWTVDDDEYLRLDAAGVTVLWEGHPGAPSTTGHFSCVNGVAYIDRRILAFVDRTSRDWYLTREGQHQAALILKPA